MKKALLVIIALLVCACSGAPVPAWKDKASRQLEDYKTYFLSGKEDTVEPHFLKARKEIAASNDLNLLAIAYLTKYALHTASLESFDASEFAKLHRLEPNAANMAYCHFLKGNFSAVDVKLIPARYAGVMKAAESKDMALANREISAIEDPLSRLVACGVWVRYMPYDTNVLQIGINTASASGWRRPLGAYLAKLQVYYQERGEENKASVIRDRLELLRK